MSDNQPQVEETEQNDQEQDQEQEQEQEQEQSQQSKQDYETENSAGKLFIGGLSWQTTEDGKSHKCTSSSL